MLNKQLSWINIYFENSQVEWRLREIFCNPLYAVNTITIFIHKFTWIFTFRAPEYFTEEIFLAHHSSSIWYFGWHQQINSWWILLLPELKSIFDFHRVIVWMRANIVLEIEKRYQNRIYRIPMNIDDFIGIIILLVKMNSFRFK